MRRVAFTRRNIQSQRIINKSLYRLSQKTKIPLYQNSNHYPSEWFPKSLHVVVNVKTFSQAIHLKENNYLIFDIRLFEKVFTRASPLIDYSTNIYYHSDHYQLVNFHDKEIEDRLVDELSDFLLQPSQWKHKSIDLVNYKKEIDRHNCWYKSLC